MSSTDKETSDQQFARQVENVLKATQAIETFERANGEKLNVVTTITCPCCHVINGLRFYRSQHHLYLACGSEQCVPETRANCRGRKRRK